MTTTKSHRELRVYQLAFQSATQIQDVTKKFPAEESIASSTKLGVLLGLFAQILQRHGEGESIQRILLAN